MIGAMKKPRQGNGSLRKFTEDLSEIVTLKLRPK